MGVSTPEELLHRWHQKASTVHALDTDRAVAVKQTASLRQEHEALSEVLVFMQSSGEAVTRRERFHAEARPAQIRVPLFAARTLNATGQSRVTLSPR